MRRLLSGNEAVARAAWEAGVVVASAYPGTPSTEILENLPGTRTSTPMGPQRESGRWRWRWARPMPGARPGDHEARRPERRRRSLLLRRHDRRRSRAGDRLGGRPRHALLQNEQDNRVCQFRRHPLPGAQRQPGSPGPDGGLQDQRAVRHAGAVAHDHPRLPLPARRSKWASRRCSRPPANTRETPQILTIPAFARQRHPVIEARISDLAEFAETFGGNRVEMGARAAWAF